MNAPIQILVVDRVFIVPNAGRWIRHLVTYDAGPIDARLRMYIHQRGTGPGVDRRFGSLRGSGR